MFDNLKNKFKRTAKRITRQELSPEDVEDIIQDLRVGLLENDVAVSVVEELIEKLEQEFEGEKIGIREDSGKKLFDILEDSIRDILTPEKEVDFMEVIEGKREEGEPAVILFVGVNGCGKTTTIAKITNFLKEEYDVVLAASDTFRAAAIDQLEKHGENLDAKVIKHQKEADAAAVAYDAVEHAKASDKDVVLIDTAGRMQTDVNLMQEMEKIDRVADPDLTVFVGDALIGNDAVEQASKFEDSIDIDGSILTKMDADAGGGAALSIVKETGRPILFLGTGQEYEDLIEFDADTITDSLLPDI